MKNRSTTKIFRWIAVVTATIVFFSCDPTDKDNRDSQSKSQQRSDSDLELKSLEFKTNLKLPKYVRKLSAKELSESLWEYLEGSMVRGQYRYFNFDASESTSSSPSNCSEPNFQPIREIDGSSVSYKLQFSESLPCNGNERFGDSTVKSTELSMQVLFNMSCLGLESKDLGPNNRDIFKTQGTSNGPIGACTSSSTLLVKSFVSLKVGSTLVSPGGEVSQPVWVDTVSSMSKNDERPCQLENMTMIGSCRNIILYRLFTDDPEQAFGFYDLEFTDIAYANKLDKYPSQGELKFRVNNWTGSVKAQGNLLPPLFYATDGQETITDLGSPPSKSSKFKLTSEPQQKMPKGIWRYIP